MNIERMERVLSTIDRMGIATIKQLHEVLKMGSYRNTCKIVNQLEKYLHVDRSKHKIVYLNKEGREFIGSDREVKKSQLFEHMLLANEVFIHYGCPVTWKREHVISVRQEPAYTFQIQVKGVSIKSDVKIIVDAFFERNGYTYLIEIDNTRKMVDNKKKIQKYLELWPMIREKYQNPRLCIFTKSEKRKKTFLEWTRNITKEIKTFDEI
jgi:hypothetical protein